MTTTHERYEYTDPQNHKLTIGTLQATSGRRYVQFEAEDLAIGGVYVQTWLPADQARALERALDARSAYEYDDRSGDTISVAQPAEDWTPFTFTGYQDEEEPVTARVVVLSARLPELRAAITAAADQIEEEAQ